LGVVTLQGRVGNRLAKQRAGEIAHVARGVRAIVDLIDVTPESPPEHALEFVAASVLSHDRATMGEGILAQAHGNVVQLSGDVDSIAALRIAEQDVLGIPGVRGVFNALAVRPMSVGDEGLVAVVERTVRSDPWLDSSRVQVSVEQGVVSLKGWVRSAAERARAESDARAASPRDVELSALRIDAREDDATVRATPEQGIPDRDVAQALKDAFVIDPRVRSFAPTVNVRHGVVVLTGVAPNARALQAAGEDARNAPGVADVQNDMKDQAAAIRTSDEGVKTQVLGAMALDPSGLGTLPIGVNVRWGRVQLQGTVPTSADRLHAIAVAAAVPGAMDVDDGLAVVPARVGVTNAQPEP
jgi:osmotically-inducible protein OsmY